MANLQLVQSSRASIDQEHYSMKSADRGLVIIFAHEYFADEKKYDRRTGVNEDIAAIRKTFEKLHFTLKIHKNLKKAELEEALENLRNDDHSGRDCFIIIVMTHGRNEKLMAFDEWYPISYFWDKFNGAKCPSLVGKPKLFFLQACRGMKTDDGVECNIRLPANELDIEPSPNQRGPRNEAIATNESPSEFWLPLIADFLFMYPCQEAYCTYHTDDGSPFIQAVCTQLQLRAKHLDLLSILTLVNQHLAIYFSGDNPEDPDVHMKKQMSSIVCTLTRQIYFTRLEQPSQ